MAICHPSFDSIINFFKESLPKSGSFAKYLSCHPFHDLILQKSCDKQMVRYGTIL
jgi:hypothetical protein